MSIASPANMPADERPVGLRARLDLVFQESVYQGESCWIVKDPLAMKYFRLRKPEKLVFDLLLGSTSYQQIRREITRLLPDCTIKFEELQQLVASMHRSGLLISNATGQAVQLQKRRSKELLRKGLALPASLIALKLPGWDPESFLSWLYPKIRWIFSPWFTAIVAATLLAAILLLLTNFQLFQSKLPEFNQFFAFENLLLLGLLLIITKSIHELGHGLMCKHFGGECHEIGFMLLVLMPAMYCNTSDSWTLPNRWHRMAIGAAGMYLELFLAAICTFVWWFTNPGWIHYLALNVMFLASVSTVIFNANPLLRFDGYFILSDFLEIPNMAQKGRSALVSKLRVWLAGMKPINPRLLPERSQTAFALYSVASFLYRWFIVILIFWFLARVFEPYGLAPIGHMLIALSLIGMVAIPGFKLIRFLRYPGRTREVKRRRVYTSLLVLTLLAAFVCFVPLPHYVWASFVVRPQAAQQLLLVNPGRLTDITTSEGDYVSLNQTVAIFENDELELDLKDLEVESARLKNDLAAFKLLTSVNLDSAGRISETRARLKAIESQIRLKKDQLARLTLRAERVGRLFPPVNRQKKYVSEPALPQWSGTPLDPKNRGAWFQSNTLLGTIGPPGNMEAILVVNQSDVKLLQPGQSVIARCDPFGDAFLQSEIAFVSQDEMVEVPKELSQAGGGPIAVSRDESGVERPIFKSYEASAMFSPLQLEERNIELLPGMRGQARIHVGSSSIVWRLRRYLGTVINFR